VQNAVFRDITKQISTVSLDQHWKIMPEVVQCYPRATLHNFGAWFFSIDLGTSQYLYIISAKKVMFYPASVCLSVR